jgi:mannosyltransferase
MDIYCDNIIFALQRAGGISVYWCELLSRMLRDELPLLLFERKKVLDNVFRMKLNVPPDIVTSVSAMPTRLDRYLPITASLPKNSVFHSSYYRIPMGSDGTTIQTAYDFTYERFGSGLSRVVHSVQKRIALENASGIICISESTKRDLLRFFPRIRADRIRVIHLGYSDEFRPVDKNHLGALSHQDSLSKNPYLVYVGDRSLYKNFSLAVHAIAQVAEASLVVVGGGKLSQTDQSLLNYHLSGRYVHMDRLPNEALNRLYNNAHALIYPSSYEGFGLPVIEAMAAGCPVIAANSSSIPEVAGDAGMLVDVMVADAFADHIRALAKASLREAVIQRGFENIKRFSWERCYQETISFYREIHSKSEYK